MTGDRPRRVLLDGTPFLDRPTGVGVFLDEVARRLVRRRDIEVGAYGLTLLGFGEMKRRVPLGVHPFDLPIPAPYVRRRWTVADSPPIEWWTGAVDVVHGPNFLVPPTHRAAEVVTVHDLTCVRFPELCTVDTLAYPAYIQRAADRGAWIHTVSHAVADEVRATFRVDPARVVPIPNGVVAVPPVDPAVGRALAGGHPYVLALGTVEPRKDHPLLVRAFDEVAARHPDLRLVIAGGDGWGADQLDAALGRMAHREAVVRLGFVDDADRAALLAGAELLAYPSRYEGFGLPPLEAMAAGTPVVATRSAAIEEVCADAASLVDLDDRDGLVEAIDRVLTDPAHRAALVERGRANVGRYSWDRTADELAALYHRAYDDRLAGGHLRLQPVGTPPAVALAPPAGVGAGGSRRRAIGAGVVDSPVVAPLLDRAISLVPERLAERRRPMVQLVDPPPGRQGAPGADPTVVRAVVLDYEGGPFVGRCVDALLATEVPAGVTLEVVVIDNASTDGSADAVVAAHPDVLVLRNTHNAGFPANNLALWDLAGVRAVALINSDAFVEPGWLAPLLDALDADESCGAACPRLLLDAGFTDVTVSSPTFAPGGADTRELGVRVLGITVDGVDVWAGTRVHGVDHGREHGPEGIFQWTGACTTFRVPSTSVDNGAPVAVLTLDPPRRPGQAAVAVTLTCGDAVTTVVLDPAAGPVPVEVPLAGPRYDLINNAGSLVFDDGYGADRGFLEPDGPAFDEPVDVFAFCGGAVLLRPDFLRDVGVLDRRFFLYYEDTDLSWRGQSRGWTYRYVPTARVRHLHAASAIEGSTFSSYFNERNRLLMLVKNAPAPMVRAAVRGSADVVADDLRHVARRVATRRRFDQLDRANLRHAWTRASTFAGVARHLIFMLRRRRQIARDALIPPATVTEGLTPRPR